MARNAPMVSVIIPFRDRVGWTVEAVQSVLEGTYQDFEVVLVDDGSSEDVSPLLVLDERVRYVRRENGGAAAARNLGLTLARGRYVAFLDSDDLFEPGKLARQVAWMEERSDIAISHTSYKLMDREGEIIEEVPAGRYHGRVYPRIYTDSHGIATPTVMVRRASIGAEHRFNESVRYGEDTLFWISFLKHSELLGIDEPLSRVRIHGSNAIQDPEALFQGVLSLMHEGIAKDEDLPLLSRRRMVSTQQLVVSRFYLKKRERSKFFVCAISAIGSWPFNYQIYKFLILFGYKSAMKRLKKG